MNPIFVAGGIAALVLFLRKNQSPTIQKVVGQDVPSPANPSGLDVAVEPSPVVKDKPEPVEDAQSESPQLVVVNDGNWSPKPPLIQEVLKKS